MSQRNLFPTPQTPTMDHDPIWNHRPHPDPHLHLGAANGSYMLPVDSSGSTAVLRPNDYPSSTFSNNMAPNSGPLHDPYLHLSSTASASRFPPTFNQHGSSMAYHQSGIGRSTIKRKNPVIPLSHGGGNTSGCYNAGSSSSLHISSNPLCSKPTLMTQYPPLDPANVICMYRSDNLLTVGDDSHRNVRSRRVQINPAVTYSSSSLPPHFHASGSLPGLIMEGQLTHVPFMPMVSQGDPRLNYEANQSIGGSTIVNSSVGTNGVIHPNLTQSRNTNSLPTPPDPLIWEPGTSSNSYHQRSNSSRSSARYNSGGFATASLEVGGGSLVMESVALSRYSRPLSITGRSSYRNGRTRGSTGRFHSSHAEDGTRTRWSSEGAVLMDRSTYYDSRTWFDQHRDMRLDIDNMSYEELLALGERIGTVSTGLSEEAMSGCLEETTHCSSNKADDDAEMNCVICLEGYKDQDKLGRLNCRHDFHVSCIKNWLQVKNACPICKAAAAAASNDTSKEKQP